MTALVLVYELAELRLLVIPGQDLRPADHVRFRRHFGPLDVYPVAKYVVLEYPKFSSSETF